MQREKSHVNYILSVFWHLGTFTVQKLFSTTYVLLHSFLDSAIEYTVVKKQHTSLKFPEISFYQGKTHTEYTH